MTTKKKSSALDQANADIAAADLAYEKARKNPDLVSEHAAGFAGDAIEIKGVIFHHMKVAHQWVITRIATMGLDKVNTGIIIAYALAHDAGEVRKKLLPKVFRGTPEDLLLEATGFMIEHEISIEDLIPVHERFAWDMRQKKAMPATPTPNPIPTGGAGSSSTSQKPSGGRKKKS